MAACTGSIGASIINDCASKPVAGVEQVVYLFNRRELTATFDAQNINLVTLLDLPVGKQGYKLTGYRKNLNAGADVVVDESKPKKWTQFFSFVSWNVLAAEVKTIDNLDDIVIVYESKNKGTGAAGAFHMLGYESGMWVSSDSKRANDNDGTRVIELTGESNVSEHIVLSTSYAATLAMLEGLMTPQT